MDLFHNAAVEGTMKGKYCSYYYNKPSTKFCNDR